MCSDEESKMLVVHCLPLVCSRSLHLLLHLNLCFYSIFIYFSPWGEHEIDYILFVTVANKGQLTLNPNSDEADDIRWVTQSQLLDMFNDTSLLFSPWFRIIAHRWMMTDTTPGGKTTSERSGWWDDLDRTMNTDDFCDHETIHRFDPPKEHMGGAGNAGPLF